MPIQINLEKSKTISHDKRRATRAEEFKPLDIKVTIPAESEQAEIDRQAIRDKYATIQIDMDNAISIEDLKNILVDNNLLNY